MKTRNFRVFQIIFQSFEQVSKRIKKVRKKCLAAGLTRGRHRSHPAPVGGNSIGRLLCQTVPFSHTHTPNRYEWAWASPFQSVCCLCICRFSEPFRWFQASFYLFPQCLKMFMNHFVFQNHKVQKMFNIFIYLLRIFLKFENIKNGRISKKFEVSK